MHLEQLGPAQIENVYQQYLIFDFPDDEQKPLDVMLTAYDEGHYLCYGLVENAILIGYAFFVQNGQDYLLDYFAVAAQRRGAGLGSVFLKLLRDEFRNASSVIAEVENPKNYSDQDLRHKRLGFYLRNGFVNTHVLAWSFGVDFLLIELALGKLHEAEEIRSLYCKLYRTTLPDDMFQEMIRV